MGRTWPGRPIPIGFALGGVAVAALAVASAGSQVVRGELARRSAGALDRQVPHETRPDYAGASRCLGCHPSEHASWRASYHRAMTQRGTVDALIAPEAFEDHTLRGEDGESQVTRRGDELWVKLVDPVWKLERAGGEPPDPEERAPEVWRRVLMTTGSHHMQVYWVAGATRRTVHAFPFAYVLEGAGEEEAVGAGAPPKGRWVPNESTLLRPPIAGGVYTWNEVCIKCHAVAPRPRLAGPARRAADTRVAEFGISCEACHGPAVAHVDQNRDPVRRYREHGAARPDPTIVNPARLDHERASETCAQCHAITRFADDAAWRDGGSAFTPGGRLLPDVRVVRHPVREVQPWMDEELLATPDFYAQRYWPDGMVRVGGREFNGLLESACYQRGEMSCLSCHSMHQSDPSDQLAAGMGGDAACVQCHDEYADADVSAAHTHHAPGSSGAACYGCHMPHTTYGLLKAMRSHEISSPSIEESTLHGRPNACNLCHLDRTLAWSMEHLDRWYGIAPVALDETQREVAASVAWALSGDAGLRALAAWHLGWSTARETAGDTWQAPILARLLNDPYAAVRAVAGRSLRRLPGFTEFPYDAVGSPESRAAAPGAVEARWRELPRAPGTSAILQGPDGELDLAAIGRLVRARDHRPVSLAE